MPRRKSSYQDNREKLAFSRRVRALLKKSYKVSFLLFASIIFMFSVWFSGDDEESKGVTGYITDEFHALTTNMGLELELVTFEGDKYIGQAQLVEELGLFEGSSMLALDLDNLRDRIKDNNWIKNAEIRRILPSKLQIKITERSPLAIWQFNKQLHLIDAEGVVLTNLEDAEGLPFPLIVGEGANFKAEEIFQILEQQRGLYNRVQAVVRLGDRRWDVHFMNGIEVMLPENEISQAWEKLSNMQKENKILDRRIKTIDMRMQDRVYIRTSANGEREIMPMLNYLGMRGKHNA